MFILTCRSWSAAGRSSSCESPAGDHEQIVEAVFDVSTLLRFGQEAQVRQLLFVIESPAGTLRVAGLRPQDGTDVAVRRSDRA